MGKNRVWSALRVIHDVRDNIKAELKAEMEADPEEDDLRYIFLNVARRREGIDPQDIKRGTVSEIVNIEAVFDLMNFYNVLECCCEDGRLKMFS